jgi:hypothetical protein
LALIIFLTKSFQVDPHGKNTPQKIDKHSDKIIPIRTFSRQILQERKKTPGMPGNGPVKFFLNNERLEKNTKKSPAT